MNSNEIMDVHTKCIISQENCINFPFIGVYCRDGLQF